MMKRRLHNIKGYQKRKRNKVDEKKDKSAAITPSVKRLEDLYAELLREVKSRKPNLEAIKEMQVMTFEDRKAKIQDMEGKGTVNAIISMLPFFKYHECTVSTCSYTYQSSWYDIRADVSCQSTSTASLTVVYTINSIIL